MKRIIAVLVVALVLMTTGISLGAVDYSTHSGPTPVSCTVQGLRPFSHKIWALDKWDRGKDGMPSDAVLSAYKKRLHCAPPHHRKAMKNVWEVDKEAFYIHREHELFRVRFTPYPGPNGTWWAIPYYAAVGESGSEGHPRCHSAAAPSGCYGIRFDSEAPTWQQWSKPGFAPYPYLASKHEQDYVAGRLRMELYDQPWSTW